MASNIAYKASVAKDLRRLDKAEARRILNKLEQTLSQNPDAGIALTGEFRGLLRFRVGDYRVIYSKVSEGILVLRIAHRKEVYRRA